MTKRTYIIIGLMLFAGLVVFLVKCNSDKQAEYNTNSAVAQNRIETLESGIATFENQIIGYHAVQDSLIQRNKDLNRLLIQNEQKYAVIALKYVKEKNRVKELPNDSAVGLFLDVAACSEVPVMKYDCAYIIPIEPIRFYNLAIVSMDELKEVNWTLRNEIGLKQLMIDSQGELIKVKDKEAGNLNKIIENKDGIIQQKDGQILNTEKKYKKQITKTYIAIGVGAVLLTLTAIF